MREIKFRAINAKNEIIYGLPYTDRVNETAYFEEYGNRLCWLNEQGQHCNQPYKNGTLMQYTGLKDTNSNEIYHGDIVRLFDSQEAWGDVDGEFVKLPTYTDLIVVWSQIDLGWRAKYMHCSNLFSSNWDCYSMEVIGNIYENPELLKFKR